jgi:hypothetical protein
MRTLIIVHRGSDYRADFEDIAARVRAIDAQIQTFVLSFRDRGPLPPTAWEHPALIVSLTSRFLLQPERGTVRRNYQVDKLVQARILRARGIPVPPQLPFRFGMKLDPVLFGDFVILKPMSLHLTSRGEGIHLLRRRNLEKMTARDFPADHLIHRDTSGYLVQKFIDTGPRVSDNRVATFFGQVLYANCATARSPRPGLRDIGFGLKEPPILSLVMETEWRWHADEDTLALARRVHAAFPDVPLLGTDILREAETGRLYVLECNPGGNTWHFSSPTGRDWQAKIGQSLGVSGAGAESLGRRLLTEQFGAFDVVARALVEATHNLAT